MCGYGHLTARCRGRAPVHVCGEGYISRARAPKRGRSADKNGMEEPGALSKEGLNQGRTLVALRLPMSSRLGLGEARKLPRALPRAGRRQLLQQPRVEMLERCRVIG